ncbi:putative oxidoreductase YdgJ [Marinobacterium sp. xm-d-420]|uniref:Gfo/Idh/MocA family protein n=1 Tax=Marinobacterium sp. xm-d-420 TaxID=2497737 RepID=UPI0015692D97|nr:Gfo/Idh/MocA family oxidoreductase [Marinobacterium sp. xm-d-420]NRP28341.1 putative oxidoreductase YdgJ [Marinobacterium sp. xm-d-420]
MTIKTAIIGYGFAAKTFHEPFLRTLDGYELIAASGSNATEAKQYWPEMIAYRHYQEMLESSSAELYIVTTPNDSHFEITQALLKAGKRVILDKPACTSSSQLNELIRLEKESSGSVSIFQNRRWDGDFLTLKKLLRSGRLGEIRRFESHFDRARPIPKTRWRELPGEGAGIWFDLGPHLVDQALQLFGKPSAVTADIRTLREGASVDDYFDVLLHYSNTVVKLHSSPFCFGRPLRFDVQGTQGRFVKYALDPQEAQLINGKAFSTPSWTAEEFANFGRLHNEQGDERVTTEPGNYAQFFEQVKGFIEGVAESPVPLESVVDQIAIIEAGFLSSQEQKSIELI